jgi:hypothetical protein
MVTDTAEMDALDFPGVKHKGPYCQPVTGRQLSDTFGAPRPGGRKHEGIDIFAPEGTPIHAISGGTVVQGFNNGLGGNVVRIQGDDGRFYYYAHLKAGSFSHLHVGEHVNAGQVIGGVGHSGDAAGTPNHLHLQVREHNQWINPYTFNKPLPDLPEAMAGSSVDSVVDPFDIDHGSPPSVADADHDGLIDQFESLFGTDPHLADTDHDGLSDSYETAVSHTDPLSADTDKDGLTDSYEIAHGSDPGQMKMPAGAAAAHFGGLATLDSDHDGLSDAYEAQIGSDPNQADSDHDGLSDAEEVARGSNPMSMDSDNDGLTDGFEAAQGTLTGAPGAGMGLESPLGTSLGTTPAGAAIGTSMGNSLDDDPMDGGHGHDVLDGH